MFMRREMSILLISEDFGSERTADEDVYVGLITKILSCTET